MQLGKIDIVQYKQILANKNNDKEIGSTALPFSPVSLAIVN